MDVDATITIDHSDGKENSAPTWKKTYGFHPLLVFLDRPDIAGGEALAGLLRAGNAGSNTTADDIAVLAETLTALPQAYRPRPDDPAGADGPRLLIRSDSAGATHGFVAACCKSGVSFSFGFLVTAPVRDAVATLAEAESVALERGWTVWYPAIEGSRVRGGQVDRSTRPVTSASDGSVRTGPGDPAERAAPTRAPSSPSPTRTGIGSPRSSPTPRSARCPANRPVWTCGTGTPGSRTAFGRRRRPGCVTCLASRSRPTVPGLEIVLTATDLLAWCKLIAFIDEPDCSASR